MNTRASRAVCLLVGTLVVAGCAEEKTLNQPSPSTMTDGSTPSDGGASHTDASVPQVMHPVSFGAGIGVSELERSLEFYENVLHLEFVEDVAAEGRTEKLLRDVRGNTVALMAFDAQRRTQMNPAKLVFAVKSVQDAYDAVLAGGGSSAAAPTTFAGTTVALTYDPDKYLVELIEAATVPENESVLVAVGIGVSSLDASADYYTQTLGLEFRRDIAVPGFMDEKELGSLEMRGLSVVLMHYHDESKDYKDVPVKIVMTVPDAERYAETIAEANGDFVLSAPKVDARTRALTGMARDLEGYWIQFQSPSP
jgi:predicted enzyme related to lactoylglutathione lyase